MFHFAKCYMGISIKWGGTPIARWLIMEKNDIKDDLGGTPILENRHIYSPKARNVGKPLIVPES